MIGSIRAFFSKHLNISVFLIIVGSIVASLYILDIISNLSDIGPWGPNTPPELISRQFPAFSGFWLNLHLSIFNILSILGFSWVLGRKNRSKVYILFFIIPLPLIVAELLFVDIFNVARDIGMFLYYFKLAGTLCWVVGLTLLFTLKNKAGESA